MGTTTEKMHKGIKDAAEAVQQAAAKGQEAAGCAVDKGKAAAWGAEKVKETTGRAAAQVQDG